MNTNRWALALAVVFTACAAGEGSVDAGVTAPVDAGAIADRDAGSSPDAGVTDDAGVFDAGDEVDAGPHRCGDGRLNTAGHPADPDFEECDDGNDVNDDGCTTSCRYQVRKLIALNYTTCALLGNGRVYCRGYNADRTLGLGEAARARYVDGWRAPRGLGRDVVDLDGGRDWVCAVHRSGELSCWGSGSYERGPSSQPMETPTKIPGAAEVVTLSLGTHSACYINADEHVYCWGRNQYGQLGNGNRDDVGRPARVPGLEAVVALDVEQYNSCAVTRSGAVWCWGSASSWRFGTNQVSGNQVNPVQVTGVETAVDVDVGSTSACARLADGTMACWGSNWTGQAGLAYSSPLAPTVIPEVPQVRAVELESSTGCAIWGDTRQVSCWGWNNYGQAGDPSTRRIDQGLRPVEGVVGAAGLAVGPLHACAWHLDGRRTCWGLNNFGQLGVGRAATLPIRRPQTVEDLEQIIRLTAGDGHICALDQAGVARCWGTNGYGQLGDGTTQTASRPQAVTQLEQVAQISAGEGFTCAVNTAGEAYCWGYNRNGQLGIASNVDQLEPQRLDLPPMQVIRGGNAYACGLDRSGGVHCWGYGSEGTLGQGNRNSSNRPRAVASLPAVQDLELGFRHVCAVTGSGNLFCWGRNNEGQTSFDRSTQRVTSPHQVMIPSVLSVAVGRQHTCALTVSEGMWCWGYNAQGQLGDNSTRTRAEPRRMGALVNISSIAAWRFGYGTCATNDRQDGSQGLYCWGHGTWGQIGDGRWDQRRLPQAVDVGASIGDRVQQVVGNERQICALGLNGRVACWGDTTLGRTGHGLDESTLVGPSPMIAVTR
ncbi:MAG: hypothetical protein VYB65_10160 [Myxococcota bacterium]|nr:hypothetical protein [Myxococcota bacterium]